MRREKTSKGRTDGFTRKREEGAWASHHTKRLDVWECGDEAGPLASFREKKD